MADRNGQFSSSDKTYLHLNGFLLDFENNKVFKNDAKDDNHK